MQTGGLWPLTHGKSVNGGSPHTCQRKREWRRYAEEMNSEKTRPNKRNWVQNGSLHFIVGDTIFSLKLAYMGDRPIPRQRGIGRKIPLESLAPISFRAARSAAEAAASSGDFFLPAGYPGIDAGDPVLRLSKKSFGKGSCAESFRPPF